MSRWRMVTWAVGPVRRSPAGVALAGAMALALSCGVAVAGTEPPRGPTVADASKIESGVEVRLGDEALYVALADPEPVAVGDRVRTDDTGYAEVTYLDGSLSRLDIDTEFEVIDLVDDAGNSATRTSMEIGRTWHRVESLGEDESFTVETSQATATVRGTAFVIDCPTTEECSFLVIEGVVELTLADGSVILVVGPATVQVVDGVAGPVTTVTLDQVLADPWLADNVTRDTAAGFADLTVLLGTAGTGSAPGTATAQPATSTTTAETPTAPTTSDPSSGSSTTTLPGRGRPTTTLPDGVTTTTLPDGVTTTTLPDGVTTTTLPDGVTTTTAGGVTTTTVPDGVTTTTLPDGVTTTTLPDGATTTTLPDGATTTTVPDGVTTTTLPDGATTTTVPDGVTTTTLPDGATTTTLPDGATTTTLPDEATTTTFRTRRPRRRRCRRRPRPPRARRPRRPRPRRPRRRPRPRRRRRPHVDDLHDIDDVADLHVVDVTSPGAAGVPLGRGPGRHGLRLAAR